MNPIALKIPQRDQDSGVMDTNAVNSAPLKSIRIRNWRNIEQADVELDSRQTILLGCNGQGKSNFLEAVYALATATSHRTHRDEELIRWDQPAAYLRGDIAIEDGELRIELGLERDPKQKRVKVDEIPLTRLSDLYGLLRVTLLAPEDMAIVIGSPENRRRYLDMAIAQLNREHVRTLQQYRRAIRQRNQIVRSLYGKPQNSHDAHLDAWDHQVSALGAEIMYRRAEFITELAPLACHYHHALAGDGEELSLDYRPSVACERGQEEQSLFETLASRRTRDIEQGNTSVGPHRDDLSLRLDRRELNAAASQGQRRTVALALRLAEAETITGHGRFASMLLIDDVVYEMDVERKSRFWSAIPQSTQRLVTSTHIQSLGQEHTEGRIYHVEHGTICDAGS